MVVIVDVPEAMPVTKPVTLFTVATAVLLDVNDKVAAIEVPFWSFVEVANC